jgi:initiation factor 1A
VNTRYTAHFYPIRKDFNGVNFIQKAVKIESAACLEGLIRKSKMPRNTTGGKNFKKFKTGAEGFRAKAAREAADDMIDLYRKIERYGKDGLSHEDKEAALYMFAGRVTRRFGHGRMEVYCHDGITRQCRIRGLLRKRGQVFIDVDHIVVVSTREAVESESEDETGVSASHDAGGTADIIGLFDEKQGAMLRKTNITRALFASAKTAAGEEDTDLFDRSELLEEGESLLKGKKAADNDDIDINDI